MQNITAGPVMSGKADLELVTVDPSTAEKVDQLVFDDLPKPTSEVNRVLPAHRMIGHGYYPRNPMFQLWRRSWNSTTVLKRMAYTTSVVAHEKALTCQTHRCGSRSFHSSLA